MPDSAPAAPLAVVGDALLDRDLSGRARRLAPDAPVPVVEGCAERIRPGGAALAALMAARDGRRVTLVTALGDDPAAATLRALLDGRVHVVPLPMDGELPQKTRVLAAGHPVARLDQGEGRAARARVPDAARKAVGSAGAVLVADYGRGTADALREILTEAARRTPLVWDPHPRGGPPVPGTRLCTPTEAEARGLAAAWEAPAPGRGTAPGRGAADGTRRGAPHGLRATAHAARALAEAWAVASVAVTLGERGALLTQGGSPLLVPAPEQHDGDACGAGDRFAATAAALLADGALPEEAVRGAVRAATEHVARGGAAAWACEAPPAPPSAGSSANPDARDTAGSRGAPATRGAGGAPARAEVRPAAGAQARVGPVATSGAPAGESPGAVEAVEAVEAVARVRAGGGTVVATGGCFDVLHAGHIGLVQAARRTGDCLVVCLNSDASVRRRKGDGRPINPLEDRARVLRALEGVDAVAVFDEDTPERLLSRLRPDIWIKGGDYALSELPEAAQLEQWGGQAVLLPYLDGRSTTRIASRMQGGRA